MVIECLVCDWAVDQGFRLSIGAVSHEEIDDGIYESTFVLEPFRDGDLFKYLCAQCAEDYNVFIDELEIDDCQALDPETLKQCSLRFESIESSRSDSVLRIEWGTMGRASTKGPSIRRQRFTPIHEARVHEECAVKYWGLVQLCCSGEGMADVPPALAS
jgi:hypothetical protein